MSEGGGKRGKPFFLLVGANSSTSEDLLTLEYNFCSIITYYSMLLLEIHALNVSKNRDMLL